MVWSIYHGVKTNKLLSLTKAAVAQLFKLASTNSENSKRHRHVTFFL